MKVIGTFLGVLLMSCMAHGEERDVWYDAQGKVVKVTPAQKEKKAWIPKWKKEELARMEARDARNAGKIGSSGVSRYYYAYPRYYGYGGYFSGRYGFGGRYNHGCYTPSRLRFSTGYRGNGWSVRIGK